MARGGIRLHRQESTGLPPFGIARTIYAIQPAHRAPASHSGRKDDTMSAYYEAYEDRYRRIHAAGGHWGHRADDAGLRTAIADMAGRFGLVGGHIIEFMCGEGAGGAIACTLGLEYTGVDISPSAIDSARALLSNTAKAHLICADATRFRAERPFDAALDALGLHMLITDLDRAAYLASVHDALKPGAPFLLYHDAYSEEACQAPIASLSDWQRETGVQPDMLDERTVSTPGGEVTLLLPRLPARPQSRVGYERELNAAGFSMESLVTHEYGGRKLSATILAIRR